MKEISVEAPGHRKMMGDAATPLDGTPPQGDLNPSPGVRVLVIDDDASVRDALRRALSVEGYAVDLAKDGEEGLRLLGSTHPDVIVLDLLMPRVNGLEVCRLIRGRGDRTPILVLTAKDAVSERIEGLDAGADDYLVKPFALEEFLARLRALLRRAKPDPSDGPLQFADLRLDPTTREVYRGAQAIELTRTEFSVLELLMMHPRQVLTRSTIFERVWGYDFGPASNSLAVYIGYLRTKTEAGGHPRLIQTVRGVGYVLRDPAELRSRD